MMNIVTTVVHMQNTRQSSTTVVHMQNFRYSSKPVFFFAPGAEKWSVAVTTIGPSIGTMGISGVYEEQQLGILATLVQMLLPILLMTSQ